MSANFSVVLIGVVKAQGLAQAQAFHFFVGRVWKLKQLCVSVQPVKLSCGEAQSLGCGPN